uniref:Geminin coiled-coil domain containing n=1 Tax=Cyprinodon variegatus TaxID=28743 RepID=A0A3Q2D8E9_CYPVA
SDSPLLKYSSSNDPTSRRCDLNCFVVWLSTHHICFQLQDTLLQREEELVRLQEENKKLRGFLNSSFVRNLQEKAKVRAPNSALKRNLKNSVHELSQTCSHSFSQQITRRLCRNLTAEFCSESSEGPACSEPNLDLWVLRTLGLKDRNTIDTSDRPETCCISGSQPLQTSSRMISSNWFPHPDYWTPSDPDFVSFDSSSSSVLCESQLPSSDFSPTIQPDISQPSKPPQTHHKGTDLAFSMSLSPSSSVKTHSFPQGQAFIRKDPGGRWNFTWVPRQEP